MTYELWDKISPVNGKEAVEIIGQEQMENDDSFFLFYDDAAVIAIESVNTMKSVYGLTGSTADEVAAAYIAFKAVEIVPLTPEEKISGLELETLTAFEALAEVFESNLVLMDENAALTVRAETAEADNLVALEAITMIYEQVLTLTP